MSHLFFIFEHFTHAAEVKNFKKEISNYALVIHSYIIFWFIFHKYCFTVSSKIISNRANA